MAELSAIANDASVARWMAHTFPHPYTPADAAAWIAHVRAQTSLDNFAIEVSEKLAGGIGIMPWDGHRAGVAAFGYWLGRTYWGRSVASEATALLVDYAFTVRGFRRLESYVSEPNRASARVLEKNGFVLEGTLRAGAVDRNGAVVDSLVYGRLNPAHERV